MTRDQLIKKLKDCLEELQRHEFLVEEISFSEMPAEHIDNEVIQLWLQCPWASLHYVPKHFLDDDLRRFAVSLPVSGKTTDIFPLAHIKKADTENYAEIAMLAIKTSGYNMVNVDPSLHSEAFFLKALEANSKALVQFVDGIKRQRGKIEWTQAMIDSAVSKDVAYLMTLDSSKIKMECVETMIQTSGATLSQLANIGLLPVMSEMVKKGLWWSTSVTKPASLTECLDTLSTILYVPILNEQTILFKAYACSFPAAQVLPLLSQPGREGLMLELYSHEELVAHMSDGLLNEHKQLKGRLLETEMGL
jgi:hypothetical protein